MTRHDPVSPAELDFVKMLVFDGFNRKGHVLDYELNRYVVRHDLWPEIPRGAVTDAVWSEVQRITRTAKPVAKDLTSGRLLHGPFEGLGYRLLDDNSVVNRFGRVLRPQTPKYGGVRYIFDSPKLGPKAQSWPLEKLRELAY